MRNWINIIREGFGWQSELEMSYPRFEQRWEDHVQDPDDEDSPLHSYEAYLDWAHEIAEGLSKEVLYRGIKAPLSVLEGDGHLGIHWSRDLPMAHDFAKSGWGNRYDDRFTKVDDYDASVSITFAIAPVHPDQTDIVETVAVTIYGGENEVCMKQNQPVKIVAIYINGQLQEGHPAVGTMRHT
jgi:hypothetical protein